jgi:hypothetical protein
MVQNGIVRNTIYDSADQILNSVDKTSAGSLMAMWTSTYDPMGNRQTILDLIGVPGLQAVLRTRTQLNLTR